METYSDQKKKYLIVLGVPSNMSVLSTTLFKQDVHEALLASKFVNLRATLPCDIFNRNASTQLERFRLCRAGRNRVYVNRDTTEAATSSEQTKKTRRCPLAVTFSCTLWEREMQPTAEKCVRLAVSPCRVRAGRVYA